MGRARGRENTTGSFSILREHSFSGHRERSHLKLQVFAEPQLTLPPFPLWRSLGACIGKQTNRKEKRNAFYSLWPVGCPSHSSDQKWRAPVYVISACPWDWYTAHVLGFLWVQARRSWKKGIQESHAWFSGVMNSGFLPQCTCYHLLFRILRKSFHPGFLAAFRGRNRAKGAFYILTRIFASSFISW